MCEKYQSQTADIQPSKLTSNYSELEEANVSNIYIDLNRALWGPQKEQKDKGKGTSKTKEMMCCSKTDSSQNAEAKASVRCRSTSGDLNCLSDS